MYHPENFLLFSILFVLLLFCIFIAKFILSIQHESNSNSDIKSTNQ